MNIRAIAMGSAVALMALTATASAQEGAVKGGAAGAIGGAVVGGPVGAVVGGAVGAVVGGITDDNRVKFREYVVREKRASVRYEGDVVVGSTLPDTVVMYDVPAEYGTNYRYTVVNDRAVLVDPLNRRIMQIVY